MHLPISSHDLLASHLLGSSGLKLLEPSSKCCGALRSSTPHGPQRPIGRSVIVELVIAASDIDYFSVS